MVKLIIGLVADISAGKDTVADYLADKYGFERFTVSDILRDEAKKQGLKPTRENLVKIQYKLRAKEGEDGLVKRLVKTLEKQCFSGPQRTQKSSFREITKDKVVIAGIRKVEEINYLKKKFPSKVKIIHLTASAKIRFQRIKQRARIGDPKTFEEFLKQEKQEWKVFRFKELFEMADFKIKNNGTLKELYKQIDKVLQKLYK